MAVGKAFSNCSRSSAFSTREEVGPTKSKSKVHYGPTVRVALRLAVYRQSVHIGAKPLEAHDQIIFLAEPLPS
jgi:hypothetical protein